MIRPPFACSVLFIGSCLLLQAEAPKVDFITEVKPIFEAACVSCHGEDKSKGDYQMHSKELAFESGDNYEGETIVPGDADASHVFFSTTLGADEDEVMPPKKSGLLSLGQQEIIKDWINQGADWPEGVVLNQTQRVDFQKDVFPILKKGGPFTPKKKRLIKLWAMQGSVWPEGFSMVAADEAAESGIGDAGPADNLELVQKMREAIVVASSEKSFGDMKAYDSAIPKTGVPYSMVAIPGGEYMMGSPAGEKGRKADEGPQRKVKIEPFWMGKFEVTWDMYQPFMITAAPRNKDGTPMDIAADAAMTDIISSPTAPYTEMSFDMGLDGYPVISMTQHGANKFCQWLSAQTGHYYRLPTEAEWEYACRAGSTGAFHCEEAELGDYAVYEPDIDNPVLLGYAKVGSKKPNPWGLYDMHGNVIEWCLDQYVADSYSKGAPFVRPTELYPRVARGGSWYDPAADCRSARRWDSNEQWKQQDPQIPKSIWYHTDAIWLGFRLVRPLHIPDAETMHDLWNLGIPEEEE